MNNLALEAMLLCLDCQRLLLASVYTATSTLQLAILHAMQPAYLVSPRGIELKTSANSPAPPSTDGRRQVIILGSTQELDSYLSELSRRPHSIEPWGLSLAQNKSRSSAPATR